MKSRYHERIGAKGGASKSPAKLASARANGAKGGRPPTPPDEKTKAAATFYLNNGGTLAETMRRFGVYRRPLVRLIALARSSA